MSPVSGLPRSRRLYTRRRKGGKWREAKRNAATRSGESLGFRSARLPPGSPENLRRTVQHARTQEAARVPPFGVRRQRRRFGFPEKGLREGHGMVIAWESGVAAALCHRTPHNSRARRRHWNGLSSPTFPPPDGGQGLAIMCISASWRRSGATEAISCPPWLRFTRRLVQRSGWFRQLERKETVPL